STSIEACKIVSPPCSNQHLPSSSFPKPKFIFLKPRFIFEFVWSFLMWILEKLGKLVCSWINVDVWLFIRYILKLFVKLVR
ncbi:unnamed protein product, partial [Brassica rapa]